MHLVTIVSPIRDLDITFGAVQPQSFMIFSYENGVIFYNHATLYFCDDWLFLNYTLNEDFLSPLCREVNLVDIL